MSVTLRAAPCTLAVFAPIRLLLFAALVFSAGCGGSKSAGTASESSAIGPTVSAHPFLQKWSLQPLDKARPAAEGGDASAQYYLGWAYLCGLGITPDAAEALRWFRKAADNGVPEAQVKTGLFHELGMATPQDFTEAIKRYEKAAEKGYVGAQVRLGMLYSGKAYIPRVTIDSPGWHSSGPAVGPNYSAAFKWYSLAAEQGYPMAQLEAARMLRTGVWTLDTNPLDRLKNRPPGVPPKTMMPKRDMVGYGKWLRVAAARGDPAAREELAKSGKQFNAQDRAEAKRQADAFIATHPAQDWTHVMEVLFHLNPSPLEPMVNASAGRFNRLLDGANKGYANAQYELALCFQHESQVWDPKGDLSRFAPRPSFAILHKEDQSVPVRMRLASQWYEAAAAQGHVASMLDLAFLYSNARLGETNRHLGLEWFRHAAEKGHAGANTELKQRYWEVLSTNDPQRDRDRQRAMAWFRRAADGGQAEAQFQLAQIYHAGRGVPADYAEAVKWYRAAAAQGHAGALKALGLSATNAQIQPPTVQVPPSGPTAPARPVTRTKGKAIRLAIVPADPSLRAATDVLTALLSQRPDLQLLERSEIDRVFQELALAATFQKDFLKLGQTLGADGLLTLEPVKLDQQQRLQLTLAAVGPGVVLASERYLLPLEDVPGWSALVVKQLEFLFPKLAVSAANALPVSILNLRSPVSTPEAVALDRELTLLLAHRLVREKELFVLERRRMDALEREKQFQGKERAAFWNGSYLLDGAVNPEGMTQGIVTLSGRLVPPEGGEGTTLEVSGRRDQLAKLVDELTGKILAALHRQTQLTSWNPLDEAARYFEEARWGLRWGMFQEAQAAAEAGWALGLHTRDMAVMRIQAYGQQTPLEVQVWHAGMRVSTVDQPPQAEKLEPARRALELFLEHSRAPSNGVNLDADWLGMGGGLLSWASRLLQHFHGRYEACAKAADALTALRAEARAVDRFLLDQPAGRETEQSLKVSFGAYWQEKPEDVARLYQELVETGLYRRIVGKPPIYPSAPPTPWSLPHLVSWTKISRAHASEVWSTLLESLCRSTNVAARLEGHLWKAASAESDYELEDELDALFNAVWENRQRVFAKETHPSYWTTVEQWLKQRFFMVNSPVLARMHRVKVPEFLRRMAAAKAEYEKPQRDTTRLALVDDVRKALRGVGEIDSRDYGQKYMQLEFTVEEARELLPLVEEARKDMYQNHRSSCLPLNAVQERLKARLPPEEIEAKRLALVNELRRDLRGETALRPAEFERKYGGVVTADFAFTPEEAKELFPLVEPFKKRLGKSVNSLNYLTGILMLAATAPPPTAAKVPVPVAPPAVAPVPPRPGASKAESLVLRVTRFCPVPLKPSGGSAINQQHIAATCFRQGRLWLQIDFVERYSFGLSGARRAICAVNLETCANQRIDPPVQDDRAAPRLLPVGQTELHAQRFEVQGDYLLAQTVGGIKKYDLRRQQWRDLATKLPEDTRFFSLEDQLYATTEDSILEFDPRTDAIKVLASCRQRPPRTVLDRLDRFARPTVFLDTQRRPCVLLANRVYAYETASNDWKQIGAIAGGSAWEQTVQLTSRLLLRPNNNYYRPPESVAFLGGQSPRGPIRRSGEPTMSVIEVKVMEDLKMLREKDSTLFPAGSISPTRGTPSFIGSPLGRGWTAALDEQDLWVLVDTTDEGWPANTGRSDLNKGGRGDLLLLRYAQGTGRPIALPLKLDLSVPGVAESLQNQGPIGSKNQFEVVATPGGLVIYWPPAVGVWYLPKAAVQPALETQARTERKEQFQRLRALQERQPYWLTYYDKNKDGVLDPEEEKLALQNRVYRKQHEELSELLKLFPHESKPAARSKPRR